MALRKSLILRKLQSSCLEGRTALIKRIFNSFKCSSEENSNAGALRKAQPCRLADLEPARGAQLLGGRFQRGDRRSLRRDGGRPRCQGRGIDRRRGGGRVLGRRQSEEPAHSQP